MSSLVCIRRCDRETDKASPFLQQFQLNSWWGSNRYNLYFDLYSFDTVPMSVLLGKQDKLFTWALLFLKPVLTRQPDDMTDRKYQDWQRSVI